MFSFLTRDPWKVLDARYKKLLKEARDLQRKGKIVEYARKTAEAEAARDERDAIDR
jgi:hypothetical protein